MAWLQVLQLKGRFSKALAHAVRAGPDEEPDEADTAKGLACMFVELAEAYCSLISTGACLPMWHLLCRAPAVAVRWQSDFVMVWALGCLIWLAFTGTLAVMQPDSMHCSWSELS